MSRGFSCPERCIGDGAGGHHPSCPEAPPDNKCELGCFDCDDDCLCSCHAYDDEPPEPDYDRETPRERAVRDYETKRRMRR